jgi:hypothetical protein
MFSINLDSIIKSIDGLALALREVAKEIRLAREEYIKNKK